jgi:hypothetical protein
MLLAQDAVLTAIKGALVRNGIDLPFPTQKLLLHDQTEETDGDRRQQHEGWRRRGAAPAPESTNEQQDQRRLRRCVAERPTDDLGLLEACYRDALLSRAARGVPTPRA